ncbi:MAG: TOBE domain-containing protein, partial [Pseudomonadota bacterium]
MADRIALMRAGRIVQMGAPYHVYNNPVDRDAAAFFSDINVVTGVVENALTDTPFGQFLAPGFENGTTVEIVIRPQHLRLDFDRGGNQPRVTRDAGVPAMGSVVRARYLGHQSLVELRMDTGDVLKVVVPSVFLPEVGRQFWLTMRRDRCHVFAKT